MANRANLSMFGPPSQLPLRPRSAEEVALASWAVRQVRLAQSVAAILGQKFEADGFQWEATDNLFGQPVDSAVVVGRSPNGDGTTSGIVFVGDMDFFADLMHRIQRPKSYAEILMEHIHWSDAFWGPLPIPYYLTQSFEENDMALSNQDVERMAEKMAERTSKMVSDAIAENNKVRANDPVESVRIRFSWPQLVGAVVAVAAGLAWIDDKFDSLEDRFSRIEMLLEAQGRTDTLMQQSIDRLEKKLEQPATSTDTGSPRPHTATGGSPSH